MNWGKRIPMPGNGRFLLGSDARNVGTGFPSGVAINRNYSSGATGGIAFAGACGAAGGVALAGFSITGAGDAWGAVWTGSIEPAACCGADAGRLRGTGG